MPYSINKEKCQGCDACTTACPTQAISGRHHEVHSIDPDICVSCGLCADFCGYEAVYDDNGLPATVCAWEDWGIPEINTALCTGCWMCVEVCPMYVLEISESVHRRDITTHARLTDIGLCIGCKKCENRCPVGAIKMISRV